MGAVRPDKTIEQRIGIGTPGGVISPSAFKGDKIDYSISSPGSEDAINQFKIASFENGVDEANLPTDLIKFSGAKPVPLYLDEEDNFVTKLAQCNNCGVIHKVLDACKSEIVRGMEESNAILTIPEIKKSLTLDLCSILETYKCDIATWENVKFIYDNALWGNNVVISKEEVDEITQIKVLQILDENKIKINTSIHDTVLTKE